MKSFCFSSQFYHFNRLPSSMAYHSLKPLPRPEWVSMMHSIRWCVRSAKTKSEGRKAKESVVLGEVRIGDSDAHCCKETSLHIHTKSSACTHIYTKHILGGSQIEDSRTLNSIIFNVPIFHNYFPNYFSYFQQYLKSFHFKKKREEI